MILALRCVGIDASKYRLDIFDEAIGTAESIANAPQPITEQVARWRCGDVFVVFEATGIYDRELADQLRQGWRPLCPYQSRPRPRLCPRLRKIGQDRCDRRLCTGSLRPY